MHQSYIHCGENACPGTPLMHLCVYDLAPFSVTSMAGC